ncbi:MAG TPA: LytTR family DNA-binding domain-containing protein [Longimicrobium sp.]|nr:LytTR family DNA-binding domain-containing protein [Longimicrobium sp.]
MSSLRAVVVDDEPVARRAIRLQLSRHPEIELAAECPDGFSAVAAVQQHRPDLLFLDVQMPGMSGFEVLERLSLEDLPFVVFVTAHDEYAVRAFEVNAIDYLLKPFDEPRFDEALSRARRQMLAAGQGALLERLGALLEQVGGGEAERRDPAYVRRLLIRDRGRIFFLPTAEIDWIESAGNYASLHAGKQSYLVRSSMTELERKLDPAEFARIHRATIVNLARVQEVRPYGGSDYRLVLTTGERLNVSRGYSARLLRDR